MSRNGSGVYTLPAGNPVVTLTAISTSWANNTLSDIANELTNSIDKGGRTAPTADLPMAGFKHTGAGDASAAGQYIAFAQATNSYVGGFFGVGVSPSTRFHVKGSLAEIVRQETSIARGSGANYASWYDPTGRKGYFGYAGSDDTLYFYNQLNELLVFGTNNTERLAITGDGRLYGKALHNNAGAVTGTTNQYIASGTYTPTLTSVLNVTSTSARVCNWLRVGNIVHVSGQCEIDPTTGLSQTQVDISLPIASALSATAQLSGAGAATNNSPGVFGNILGNNGSDRASLFFWAPSTPPNDLWSWTFSYEVL